MDEILDFIKKTESHKMGKFLSRHLFVIIFCIVLMQEVEYIYTTYWTFFTLYVSVKETEATL